MNRAIAHRMLPLAAALGLLFPAAHTHAQTTGSAFTYQGRLQDGTQAANGLFDFSFTLLDADAPGAELGAPLELDDVPVENGVFSVELDFGSVFDGGARWLAIGVRSGEETGAYDELLPRQPLTAAPYAHFALNGNPGPQGPQGEPGPQGDPGFGVLVWRGEWFMGETYATGDAVSHNGSAWVANNGPFNNIEPGTDAMYWKLLVAKGDAGPAGPAGPPGPQGVPGELSILTVRKLEAISCGINPCPLDITLETVCPENYEHLGMVMCYAPINNGSITVTPLVPSNERRLRCRFQGTNLPFTNQDLTLVSRCIYAPAPPIDQ